MASKQHPLFLALLATLTLHSLHISAHGSRNSVYIVLMKEKIHDDPAILTSSHYDLLASVLGSMEEARSSIIHSYKHGFSGFAARLNESCAKQISGLPEVLSVQPSRDYELHTTRSWEFIRTIYNQPSNLLANRSIGGEGMIIGIVDTGIWPESPSFHDAGYGPPPSKWKGTCEAINGFSCNKKIIGARFYRENKTLLPTGEYWSPRDASGHGTHVAATAAGSFVQSASYNGLANGWAYGGAPRAFISVYKVCWTDIGCPEYGIMGAIDHAINDGVDVLSLSIGGSFREIPGTLYAVSRGIPVVFSAGNNGPAPQTVGNAVPWVLTVAATTVDRSFPTVITLGNQLKLVGQSLHTGPALTTFVNIVYFQVCDRTTLSTGTITGRIVFCYDPGQAASRNPRVDLVTAIDTARSYSAAGLIFAQYTSNIVERLARCGSAMPCVIVDYVVARQIMKYMLTNNRATALIARAQTTIGEIDAPTVAAFSSRGPSASFPGILKPDVAAPGAGILAAVRDGYQFMSGTSMACPHISALVTLLRAVRPTWSPAAIKSAFVTTASVMDARNLPILEEGIPRKEADPFDFGGGFVNLNKLAAPGLVYDIDPNEFTNFFHCTLAPNNSCWQAIGPVYKLNLPSISIPNLMTSVTVSRTVTNVGNPNSIYNVTFQSPPGVTMTVQPSVLSFSPKNKQVTFQITFAAKQKVQGNYRYGSLSWSDGNHVVRIPIAVRTVLQDFYAQVA